MTLCAVVLTFVLAHTPYPTTPLLSAVLYAHSVWPIGLGPPDRLPGTELAYGAVPQPRARSALLSPYAYHIRAPYAMSSTGIPYHLPAPCAIPSTGIPRTVYTRPMQCPVLAYRTTYARALPFPPGTDSKRTSVPGAAIPLAPRASREAQTTRRDCPFVPGPGLYQPLRAVLINRA
eukprot:354523-Rhodomonas_salina.1